MVHRSDNTQIVFGRFEVKVRCDDRRVIEAVESSLDRRRMGASEGRSCNEPAISLRLELSTAPANMRFTFPPRDAAASSFEDVELYGTDGVRILTVARKSMVRIDRSTGVARGFVAPKHLESPWIIAHRIVYLAVVELLRCRGAHYLHAGCVCGGDAGILVCGPSGSGKSTLTYALARAGFGFVSDDGVFLERDAGGLSATAFPEKIKLDHRSCNLFDELRSRGSFQNKVELSTTETGLLRVAPRARPSAVLFPVRSSAAVSATAPLGMHDAFARLLGQVIPSLAPCDVSEHLEIIGRLVEACPCYELRAARDFDAIPELVARAVGVRAQ
ncbi:MAG: hypothetical protein P8181_05390 [bacterium]